VRVAQNPRNALGFAIAQPNLQKMAQVLLCNGGFSQQHYVKNPVSLFCVEFKVKNRK
jgi:hypothetical protein